MRTEGLVPDDDNTSYPEARLGHAPRNDLLTWFADHQSGREGRGSDVSDTARPVDREFAEACINVYEEARNLLWRKHRDYGPKNISNAPGNAMNGLLVRMHDKQARLNHLWYEALEPTVKDETLEDTLIDLANYALIGVLVLRGQWPS